MQEQLLSIYSLVSLTFLTFLDHLLVQGRPVFESSSIFGLVPCLQSVGISSCLPVCCPSISFSVGLGSFSQRPLVLAILHRCGWVLASSSDQTTLVFCFPGKFQQVLRVPPSWCLHFWCGPTWSSLLPISTSSFLLNLVCSHLSSLRILGLIKMILILAHIHMDMYAIIYLEYQYSITIIY